MSSELGITNVQTIAARIEAHEGHYDVVTSRAFASLTDFVQAGASCLKPHGHLCAMKGKVPTEQELEQLDTEWHINTVKLSVPNLEDTRHLIELSRKNV